MANVRIRLQNDAVLTYLRTLTTDAQGKAVLTDLPPGTYTYRASGPRHADRSGRIFVRPGVTTSERVHLQYQTISIDFSVTETTIKDEYQISPLAAPVRAADAAACSAAKAWALELPDRCEVAAEVADMQGIPQKLESFVNDNNSQLKIK